MGRRQPAANTGAFRTARPSHPEGALARTSAPLGWSPMSAKFRRGLQSDDYRPEHLACLVSPRAHPPLRAGRRNEPLLGGVRALALIFAVLKSLWIPLDASLLPARTAEVRTPARIGASIAFGALAGATRQAASLARVYASLIVFRGRVRRQDLVGAYRRSADVCRQARRTPWHRGPAARVFLRA